MTKTEWPRLTREEYRQLRSKETPRTLAELALKAAEENRTEWDVFEEFIHEKNGGSR